MKDSSITYACTYVYANKMQTDLRELHFAYCNKIKIQSCTIILIQQLLNIFFKRIVPLEQFKTYSFIPL